MRLLEVDDVDEAGVVVALDALVVGVAVLPPQQQVDGVGVVAVVLAVLGRRVVH